MPWQALLGCSSCSAGDLAWPDHVLPKPSHGAVGLEGAHALVWQEEMTFQPAINPASAQLVREQAPFLERMQADMGSRRVRRKVSQMLKCWGRAPRS